MVVLRVPENSLDLQDEDIGQTWEELAARQQRGDVGKITKETLEDGDTLAMEDRNCFAGEFNRRVFVHVASEEYVLVFDEDGAVIDEPSEFVEGGWQLLRGGHGFLDDWSSDEDEGYYRLGVLPADAMPAREEAAPAPEEDAPAPAPAALPASKVMEVGTRIAESFMRADDDTVGKRDGGLVVAAKEGECLIAFDDGELTVHVLDQVKWLLMEGKLQQLGSAEQRGLVADEWQADRALDTSALKVGTEYAPVGVLLGVESLTLCKQTIYSAHHLSKGQLEAALREGATVQRPTRGGGGAGDDKRGGLATFRRGDYVVYTGATCADERPAEEIVFGVMSFFHRKQQYRYLITFDETLEEFSIGSWTAWRRLPADGVDPTTFQREESEVKVCSDETKTCMLALWQASPLTSTSLDTLHKETSLGPACERAARASARKEKEKERQRGRKGRQREERERKEREEAAAREAAARAAAAATAGGKIPLPEERRRALSGRPLTPPSPPRDRSKRTSRAGDLQSSCPQRQRRHGRPRRQPRPRNR